MPSILPSRMAHSSPSQADLDILSLLTSDQSSLGPLPSGSGSQSHTQSNDGTHAEGAKKKVLPKRESHMDALLLSAVIAGSGPVTRHHVGHGAARPGSYASCDDSRPSTPSTETKPSPKIVMRSGQAPRSERLRLERQEATSLSGPSNDQHALSTSPSSSTGLYTNGLQGRKSNDRPRRKMSIDPTPITQTLQKASSPVQNDFSRPGHLVAASPKLKVRCMARTRVPTPHGEIFLHLYHNSHDRKEHLAIVFDPIQLDDEVRRAAPRGRKDIRSKSLDEKWREGETDMERMVRGAYVGRLTPGRSEARRPDRIDEEDVEMPSGTTPESDIRPLVRIHSECYTGETIGSMRCDCGEQLDEAMRLIAEPQPVSLPSMNQKFSAELPTPISSRTPSPASSGSRYVPGRGVVIYLRQEGRGIGLLEKIRAYNLQDLGHDTVNANLMLGHGADERKYDIAGEILKDLGMDDSGIRLLTNNPEKVEGLSREGVKIAERVGMTPRDWKCRSHPHGNGNGMEENEGKEEEYQDWRMRRAGVGLIGATKANGPELEKYLRTKVERMGHMIDIPDTL